MKKSVDYDLIKGTKVRFMGDTWYVEETKANGETTCVFRNFVKVGRENLLLKICLHNDEHIAPNFCIGASVEYEKRIKEIFKVPDLNARVMRDVLEYNNARPDGHKKLENMRLGGLVKRWKDGKEGPIDECIVDAKIEGLMTLRCAKIPDEYRPAVKQKLLKMVEETAQEIKDRELHGTIEFHFPHIRNEQMRKLAEAIITKYVKQHGM